MTARGAVGPCRAGPADGPGADGLFGNDETGFAGPWSGWLDEELSLKLTGWHKLAAKLLYAWLGLHVAAVAAYVLVRRQPLLRAMWQGHRPGAAPAAAERPRLAWLLLSLGLAVAAWSLLRVSGLD